MTPDSPEYWAAKVRSIKRFTQGDKRAPYKPLLLLWLIGRQAAGLPTRVSFREAEGDLLELMDEHRMGATRARVENPFIYLGSDRSLWRIEDLEGSDISKMPQARKMSRPFLLEEAVGALAPDFEQALHNPYVRSQVVNTLLDMCFPETRHTEILAEVNLAHLVVAAPPLKDPEFEQTVLSAYDFRCSFCGFNGALRGRPVAVDAAHLQMPSHRGPDHITNGLALCAFHHRLFDRGALGLNPDHRILVSQQMTPTRTRKELMPVMKLAGVPMRMPQPGYDPPAAGYIDWHYRNLFVKPPRRPSLAKRQRFRRVKT